MSGKSEAAVNAVQVSFNFTRPDPSDITSTTSAECAMETESQTPELFDRPALLDDHELS